MANEARTALVTGATGFIGSHAVDLLLETGYKVRCLVRSTSNTRWLEGKPVELRQSDLLGGWLVDAVASADVVIHCAGLTRGSRRQLFAANHVGTRALIEAILQTDQKTRIVLCSSQAAAGPGSLDRPRSEEDNPNPTSHYGESKLAAEQEVLRHCDQLEAVVLRPVAVYGPRDEDTLPYFQMAVRGVMVAPGWRQRLVQLVHARDVARALVLAAESATARGRAYFVGHPEQVSWKEVTAAISRAVGRRTLLFKLPSPLLRAAAVVAELAGSGSKQGQLDRRRARDMSERAWTCRVDRIMAELGWSPLYDCEAGFRATVEWYREAGWL